MKSDYVTKSYENDHFILNLNNLQLGDIILEHGYKPHSIAICKATKSHYSHAMIYAGHTIIEATSHGRVYSRIPNRIFVHNQNDIKVLRLREKTPDTILEKIVTEAKLLTGTKYSLKEAILVLNSTEKQNLNLTRKQFCSRLVAQCYSSAGIDIVKNNSYCSPQDI
ncbi:YiiX/YebB-like N1pC/P60 family cysteine hydrolase, partial [Morganella morganii]